jgi:PBCV-specific basic adaptor domain
MKKLLFVFGFMFVSTVAFGHTQVWVDGYTNSNGTYVPGHYRSAPNTTATDNYSTHGNSNPNTGTQGTRSPYNTTQHEERTLYTGPNGGTYYINSNGNKVYVK